MQWFPPLFQPHPTSLYSLGSSYKISVVQKKKKKDGKEKKSLKSIILGGPAFFEPAETEDHSSHSLTIECLKTVMGL